MIKLAKDSRMRQYELTFLLPVNYTSTELTKVLEQLQALCKKRGLSVISETEWGEKPLAYAIHFKGKPVQTALYYHWVLEGSASKVPKFENELRLMPDLIRHLLVVADETTSASTDLTTKSEE